jgi:multicomponent Na+:H+ antiporter subunit E
VNNFLANLLLAYVWALAIGQFSLQDLLSGFLLGYLALWIAQRGRPSSKYFSRIPQLVQFAAVYFWDLVRANIRVAYDVVTPRHYMRPGVIAIPLDVETDTEISLLANLITLTPGTLSLDVSPDRRVPYIHAMYIDRDDIEALRRSIKDNLERRVLQVMR